MIRIQEIAPPRKVSGLSSFLVFSPYNPQVINVIQGIGACAYFHRADSS